LTPRDRGSGLREGSPDPRTGGGSYFFFFLLEPFFFFMDSFFFLLAMEANAVTSPRGMVGQSTCWRTKVSGGPLGAGERLMKLR
jgi:hypothetical protein